MASKNGTQKRVKLSHFKPQTHNTNKGNQSGIRELDKSIRRDGYSSPMVAAADGEVFAGSKRLERAADVFGLDVQPIIVESDGTRPVIHIRTDIANAKDPRAVRLGVADNIIASMDLNLDGEMLALLAAEDAAIAELVKGDERSAKAILEYANGQAGQGDAEPQIDRAEELNRKWQVKVGDLWRIGEHRLLCGDSTKREDVERVMGGEKAILCHADPPYGMGKEKDGIANDNLYREKLDAFQMAWWSACRPSLENNASTYIWGNAEDLWRLWYRGLKDSERLTFRNEITWDKGSGQGMGAGDYRMYAMSSERCLFFVIGEQGYNNNADNYFDGWTPIVDYLEKSRQLMGWSIKDTKRIAGHSEKSGCHWFDKSQWTIPTKETYSAWQAAANGDAFKREYDAFKREYDDLKREFYATRAPFNNTHSLMTDVWKFETMRGDERPDHPTPKPPEMIGRIIKTSGTDDAPTLAPFLGTAPEMVSAQNIGRKVYGMEIDPRYCAVILQRMQDAFGITGERVDHDKQNQNGKARK